MSTPTHRHIDTPTLPALGGCAALLSHMTHSHQDSSHRMFQHAIPKTTAFSATVRPAAHTGNATGAASYHLKHCLYSNFPVTLQPLYFLIQEEIQDQLRITNRHEWQKSPFPSAPAPDLTLIWVLPGVDRLLSAGGEGADSPSDTPV